MFDKISDYNEKFQSYFSQYDEAYNDEDLATSLEFKCISASLSEEFLELCKNYISDCNINGIFEVPMRKGMFLSTDLIENGISLYGTIDDILSRILWSRGILVSILFPALVDEKEIGFDSFERILEIIFLQPNSKIELLDTEDGYSKAQLKMFEEAIKLREYYKSK